MLLAKPGMYFEVADRDGYLAGYIILNIGNEEKRSCPLFSKEAALRIIKIARNELLLKDFEVDLVVTQIRSSSLTDDLTTADKSIVESITNMSFLKALDECGVNDKIVAEESTMVH